MRYACLNQNYDATTYFHQSDEVHFFFEFEALADLEVAAGGVALSNDADIIPYAKTAFQQPLECPTSVPAGSILRFHHTVTLDLEPGNYNATFGLASANRNAYLAYRNDSTEERLVFQECSRVRNALRIQIAFPESGNLPFFGLANLPDSTSAQVIPPTAEKIRLVSRTQRVDDWPTLLHLTHWKAGSQWVRKILEYCAPGRIVEPVPGEFQVRHYPMRPGDVYPTVYLTRAELEQVSLPPNTRKFVVIRDLRDTLVSGYFSFKTSHPILTRGNQVLRETLERLDTEAGMLFLMDDFLATCAAIQLSWLESGEPVIRYEDLLQSDVEILTDVLIDKCRLPVSPELLREAILRNRFESLSGRPRGQEDRNAHERKGIAGDWRNHFTPGIAKAFKARFGGLLAATGYESNLDW